MGAPRGRLSSRVAVVEPSGVDRERFQHGVAGAGAGRIAFAAVRTAATMAREGQVDAIATAPITKASFVAARLPYRDHTEFFTEFFRARPSMMLVAAKLRVLHATGHLALAEAVRRITPALVWEKLFLLRSMLSRLGIGRPTIGLAAINPHAGEGGAIGNEEREVLTPVVAVASRTLRVVGPVAADVVFRQAARGLYDGVLSPLHDAGHIAVKMVSGIEAVQISAGLPIVRTSPAHGSAPDIAGKGKADPVGMIQAILLAAELARRPTSSLSVPPIPRRLLRGKIRR